MNEADVLHSLWVHRHSDMPIVPNVYVYDDSCPLHGDRPGDELPEGI